MLPEIRIVPSPNELAAAAAAIFLETGRRSITNRGQFALALAGGSTPLPLYRRLAESGESQGFPWDRVDFFWGDERTVPRDHPESNYFQAQRALLAPLGISPHQVHPVQTEHSPADAARLYQQEILDFFPDTPPQFDLILLGMGSDGHTASLFPGTSAVESAGSSAESWVEAVHVPRLDDWRITFTSRLINNARQILFLVSGESKAETLAQVLQGPHQPRYYPSQLIQGSVTWLVDSAAGSLLNAG